MCCTVMLLRVVWPKYERTTFGGTANDPSAGKNHTASLKQLCGDESPVVPVGFLQFPRFTPVEESRTSLRVPPESAKSILLSPVPSAQRVTVPDSLSGPTVQVAFPVSITSATFTPPVIAATDCAAYDNATGSLAGRVCPSAIMEIA